MIKSSLTPPQVDQATVDHYVAKGSRLRSKAIAAAIRSLFTQPEHKSAPSVKTTRTA